MELRLRRPRYPETQIRIIAVHLASKKNGRVINRDRRHKRAIREQGDNMSSVSLESKRGRAKGDKATASLTHNLAVAFEVVVSRTKNMSDDTRRAEFRAAIHNRREQAGEADDAPTAT